MIQMPFNAIEPDTQFKIVLSAGLVLTILILRAGLANVLVSKIAPPEYRRRWMVNTRNTLFLLVVVGLTAIWAEAIRGLAVSLLAIAVAFVIAMKDLLQSVLGSLVRAATNAFSVGDRVVIGSHRGDVIDQNLLTTTILEVGPGSAFHLRTGRVITFPNSKLLEGPLINESYTKRYVIHMFSVPLSASRDWKKAEQVLLDAANAECEHYLDFARESMKSLEESHGLDGLPVRPRVSVQVTGPKDLTLLVRVPAPVGRQGNVEQAVIRRYLEACHPLVEPAGVDPDAPSDAIASAAARPSEGSPENGPEIRPNQP